MTGLKVFSPELTHRLRWHDQGPSVRSDLDPEGSPEPGDPAWDRYAVTDEQEDQR